MKLLFLFFLGGCLVFPGLAAPKKTKKKQPKKTVVQIQELRLNPSDIFEIAKERARSGNATRLPQIDILQSIFLQYEGDPALKAGTRKVLISGADFSSGFFRAKHLFGEVQSQDRGVFESRIPPPEIQYSNYRSITLSYDGSGYRLEMELQKPYSQEVPFTFGATIQLKSRIKARIRKNASGSIVETLFDKMDMVLFSPPSIAFFVPQIKVKIASTVETVNGTYGYVIGVPKSAPDRYMAVRYNLTTCAKSSIKTFALSPIQYKNKLRDADYFQFVF